MANWLPCDTLLSARLFSISRFSYWNSSYGNFDIEFTLQTFNMRFFLPMAEFRLRNFFSSLWSLCHRLYNLYRPTRLTKMVHPLSHLENKTKDQSQSNKWCRLFWSLSFNKSWMLTNRFIIARWFQILLFNANVFFQLLQ